MRVTALAAGLALLLPLPSRAQPRPLDEAAVSAFLRAEEAATTRLDWTAVQAGYTADAKIFGLYYDRDHVPHIHDGPAAADNATMAALTTARRNATGAVAVHQVTVAPDGQRATVSYERDTEYDQGGKHMQRSFDMTAIIKLVDGSAKFLQVISLERPRQ